MLNPEERYDMWKTYKELAKEFFSAVEEDLDYKFAPCYQSEADKDTPNVRKLFGILESLSDFIKAHCEELEIEVDEYETISANLYRNFDAWSYGLCPQVAGKIYHGFYEDIARFKQTREISQEDTEQAVSLWKASQKVRAIA